MCSKSFILQQRELRPRLGNYMSSNPVFLENLRDKNKRLKGSIWGLISLWLGKLHLFVMVPNGKGHVF